MTLAELDTAELVELQHGPVPADQQKLIIAELHRRLVADPAAPAALIARRDLDHDLQRLLRPRADDDRFVRGVAAAFSRDRLDSAAFVRVVARRTLARRQRAVWLAVGLPIAALLLVGVGIWWSSPAALAPPQDLATAGCRIAAGTGWVHRSTGEIAASRGLALHLGDTVTSGEGLQLTWDDQSVLVLAAGTRCQLQAPTEGAGKQVLLESGDLEAGITRRPEGRPLALVTATARVEVLGTRFALHADGQGTRLEMRQGEVRFINRLDQQVSIVRAGETAAARLAPPAGQGGESWRARHPEWLWCDDFEEDRSAAYFEVDNAEGSFARTPGVGIRGSCGMRALCRPGVKNAGGLKLTFGKVPSPVLRPVDAGSAVHRDIYWRLSIKTQPGWGGGLGFQLSRAMVLAKADWAQAALARVGSSDADGRHLLIDPASGMDAAGILQTTGYNDQPHLRWLGAIPSATPIFDPQHAGTWHGIETHMRLNDAGVANGVFEAWIDGVLEARRTDLDWLGAYEAYGINAVFIENWWDFGAPKPSEYVIDDVVVSTQPIGPIDTAK